MIDKDLASFPVHTVHPDRVLFRIHKAIKDPLHFGVSGDERFDLKPETGAGTCYCALSPLGAFVETLGRFKFLTQELIDERALSSLSLTRPLRFADITHKSIIGSFGIAGEISAGPDYEASQQWAERFHKTGFDGVFYAARHDPSFTERSVAVFGNEESGAKLFEVVTEAIPHELVKEACAEFGFTVWPSAPLV